MAHFFFGQPKRGPSSLLSSRAPSRRAFLEERRRRRCYPASERPVREGAGERACVLCRSWLRGSTGRFGPASCPVAPSSGGAHLSVTSNCYDRLRGITTRRTSHSPAGISPPSDGIGASDIRRGRQLCSTLFAPSAKNEFRKPAAACTLYCEATALSVHRAWT